MINSQVWLKNNEDWIAGIYIGKVEEKFKVTEKKEQLNVFQGEGRIFFLY